MRPIPDRLVTELTAHRTLALRDALAKDPDIAFVAALHVLCLKTVLSLRARTPAWRSSRRAPCFGAQAPGLADTPSAQGDRRPARRLGRAAAQGAGRRCGTCSWLSTTTAVRRCSRTASALTRQRRVRDLQSAPEGDRPCRSARPSGRPRHGGSRLASDGRELSRPRHERRASSRRCAKRRATRPAERIRLLKKAEMAKAAEELLTGSGWLPEPLRTPGQIFAPGHRT